MMPGVDPPRTTFRDRLLTYLLGVGVGLLLLGIIWLMRYQAALMQRQVEQAREQALQGGGAARPEP
jgi:hypothetical protein